MIKVHEGPPRSLHCVVPLGEAKREAPGQIGIISGESGLGELPKGKSLEK